MKQHPLSAAFPAMPDDQFEALKDSITNIGVQEPITTYEGMVLDGWHRWTAANEVGVSCPTVELGDVDPQDFVLAKNKARRHISASQLAAAVVAVYVWKKQGNPSATTTYKPAPGAGLVKSDGELAELAGVSLRTIRQAKVVESKASAEVKEAVKTGAMSVKKAAETVTPKKAKPEPEDVEYFGPSAEEIDLAHTHAREDMASLEKLMLADDKLAAAVEEIKRLGLQLAAVESARDGYMNRCNELISRVKWLKNKLAKSEAANV